MKKRDHNRISGRLPLAAGLLCATLGLAPAPAAPAQRRAPFNRRPGFQRPVVGRVPADRPAFGADVLKARQVMALYLREGQRQPYVAEQTTRLLNGMVQESQITVKRGGPGRERMEFLSPPSMKGEVILQTNGRLFHYKPSQNRIFEGVAPLEDFQARARQFMDGVRSGRITVRATGSEIVAGRSSTIVEIKAENGGKRFWIDDKTGVRLRTEELNNQGSVVQTSYFTKIDYGAGTSPRDFQPNTLPSVPHEAVFPKGPPLASVEAAQPLVSYTIRQPAVPAGYRLSGVWVVELPGGRQTTVLRYSEGVRTFALFQQPLPPRLAGRADTVKAHFHNGVSHWTYGGDGFTLLGNLRRDAAQQIIDSLR